MFYKSLSLGSEHKIIVNQLKKNIQKLLPIMENNIGIHIFEIKIN